MMRRASVLVWVGVVGAGCSVITDLGGLGGGGSSDGAAPGDGAQPQDVQASDSPTPSDAGGNLLTNGGFEQNSGTCSPGWTAFNATLMPSATAHTGQQSCLVCGQTAGAFSMFASPRPVTNPPANASYFAQAWFQMVPDAAIALVGLEPYEYWDGGGAPLNYGSVSGTSQGWQAAQAPGTTTQAGTSIGFEIHASTPDGSVVPGCFLMDDAVMVQQ